MSFGFKVISGTSGFIQQVSSDEPAGVKVDEFTIAYGTTENRSYPSGVGYSQIFAACSLTGGSDAIGTVLVNIAGLSVSVQSGYAGPDFGTFGARCVIVGK